MARKENTMNKTMHLGWLVAFGMTVLWLITLFSAFETVSVLERTLNNLAQ